MSALQGKWIWYELMTRDDAGAKAFYEAVVGWTITLGAHQPMNYGFIANADGQMTGGILPISPEMADKGALGSWLGYIGVDDCDAAVAAILASGGKLLMPATDIEHVGRIAMVGDLDAVPFYVMTPQPTEGAEGGSTAFDIGLLGCCGWNELEAANQQGALDFYTALFGWTLPEPMDMGTLGKYQFIEHGGCMIGGITGKMPQTPRSIWRFYFRVADIDLAAQAVRDNGGTVYLGPMEVPGDDWIIQGKDPQGVVFALVGARAVTPAQTAA